MRPGGTQTKRGAAVRIRRRLGLAPRAYALLSCSLVLVIAGVSAYGMTVPSMMQAHAAREPRVGHEAKSDLGTTTGYAWASVVGHIVFGTDDADGAEAPDNEVTLANGKTIVLTNTKIIDRLSNNSVAATVNKVEQQKEQDAQQSGKPGSSDTSGSGSDSSSSGGGSGSGSSTGGPGNGGSTGGNTDNDANSGGLSAAEEESIHSWLVTKYNMLDGYVSRANDVVSTYNSTGDPRPCDSLVGEMFVIRAEFGRQTFSPRSRWYQQYANLWAVTPTYVNGSAITAMMTSRSVTSTITWRRLPYDDRSCIHHTTIARSRSHGRPAPGACRRVEPAIALGQDELPAYLRRFTILFADDATMRRGGIGRVTRAVNAQGEAVALKQLILPTRDEFDDDAAHEALVAKFKAAFREEYECHRALSGLKGFPRLYGWGEVDGVPAIVMEWVEGETLARLRSRLAVDDAGRLSPLVAARLGRDLFDLLCRMSLVGEGFVHRDISPANIMVRTARLPLDRQLAEGTFDLCLIDFGSSLALEPASAVAGTGGKASFTERYATLRRATVAYAPPEMLTDDIPDLRALRMSPAIDVYAAASTVYELIAGVAPYEAAPSTSGTSGSRKKTRDIASPYRLKMDTRPDYPIGAHAPGCDLTQLLRREPDVALAAAEQAQQLGLEPDSEELRDALAFVDAQLFDVVMACLSSHQKDRPEPAAVEAALSAFCDHYAQNVGRSLRGEPLTPCPMDASGRAVRRAAMIGAAVVCSVVWAVVVVSAALLASGARVTATLGSLVWSGSLPGIIAALALALPGIAGVAAGALARDRRSGFLQGVLALSACEVPVLVVAACSVFSQRAVMGGLVAALVATYTLTWFLLAMGFAFELPVSAPRRTKAQMATPLAGGAAAARTFGGPVEVSSDSISTTKEA